MHACAPMNTCMHSFMRHAYVHSCKHSFMHMFGICAFMQTCIHVNMHSCKHAFMQTCLHTCINLQVCMRTCVHLYMQPCLHTCMMREIWCLVWWERERESGMQRKNDFTETILSPLTPDSFTLSRSHQTSSFSLSLSPPTNLIPSLLLESQFSLFLSHSLSRHVRFYSNLSSHYILISLSHIHMRTHIHRLLFFRARLRELKKCESWPKP